jgi:hypothetical protein
MALDDRDEAHEPNSKTSTNRHEIKVIFFFMALDFGGKCNIFPAKRYDFEKKSVFTPL